MKSPNEIPSRRAVLEAKLREVTTSFRDRSVLMVENSADMLDSIRMATDRDVILHQMNISTQILADVREALIRLGKPEYGICEDCEGSIPPRRLDAIPWTPVCAPCQEARDRQSSRDQEVFSIAA